MKKMMSDKKVVRRVCLELIDYTWPTQCNRILKTKWTRGKDLPKPLYKRFIDFLAEDGVHVTEDEIHSLVRECTESSSVIMDLDDRYALRVHRWNYQKKMTELEKAFELAFS